MANRRMFAKSVVCNDSFLDLSHAAQALYLQLGVSADDDGFVDSPRTIMRMTSCKQEHLNELEEKGFIISFPSGVIVQRHWKQNNQIRPDRYTKTAYQEEFSRLIEDRNGCYLASKEGCQPNDNQTGTTCQPNDNQTEPQYRLGKDSIDKFSLEKVKTGEGRGDNNGGNPPISPFTVCGMSADDLEALGVVRKVAEKLSDWITSRLEQGDPITETGLKSLVGIAKDKITKHGADAVAQLITECMASGYKGITWDRLERARSGTTGKSEYLERIDNRISDIDGWLARREAQSDVSGVFDFGQGNEGCVSESKFLTG